MNIAINGFGRIGRAALKIALKKGLNIVAINDLTDVGTLAMLLRYDTVYGVYDKKVETGDRELMIDGKKIEILSEKDPLKLPWEELEVDVVLECTGVFRDRDSCQKHIDAGANKVIISAPAKDKSIKTYVLGVNEDFADDKIINNASCTTNCIAPIAKIIDELFGIKKAMMSTVHAYTADQNLVDGPHKDLRRARSAGVNIIPTTTGAAQATTEVLPNLKNRFDGMAIRVPVACGSLSDLTFVLDEMVTVEKVNNALKNECKKQQFKNIVKTTSDPIVSSDIIMTKYSAIIDLSLTQVVDGDLVKIIAWYDNEWGYANRLVEMTEKLSRK